MAAAGPRGIVSATARIPSAARTRQISARNGKFWQIGQRLDIDRDIDACVAERELEGIPLQMVIAALPFRRCRMAFSERSIPILV